MYICVSNLTIMGSDNGMAPTNAGILLIGPTGGNFSDIIIKIQTLSFKKMHFDVSSAK